MVTIAKVFDKENSNWDRQKEYNIAFLRALEHGVSDKFHIVKGKTNWVGLPEILDTYGFYASKEEYKYGYNISANEDRYFELEIVERKKEPNTYVLIFKCDHIDE